MAGDRMRRLLVLILVALAGPSMAGAWDAHTHRTMAYLALDGLPEEMPSWLRDVDVRHRIAFQSNEPDRRRGFSSPVLEHLNNPDHYLDVDLLGRYGLSLEGLPRLRRVYLSAMILAKEKHPERFSGYDPARDPARSKEWPGFLAHAISEEYALLQAAFFQVRILESLDDPRRIHQLRQAREMAVVEMGRLGHFICDAAQPLHTTRHYNGWVGDNPRNYTRKRSFHSYVDGKLLRRHGLTYDTLRSQIVYDSKVDAKDPWKEILAYLSRSFDRFETLYRLERDGELEAEAGRKLALECLDDGITMLSALYRAAYAGARPTAGQIEKWARINRFDPELIPGMVPASEASPGDDP
jgi:hypothetical protein